MADKTVNAYMFEEIIKRAYQLKGDESQRTLSRIGADKDFLKGPMYHEMNLAIKGATPYAKLMDSAKEKLEKAFGKFLERPLTAQQRQETIDLKAKITNCHTTDDIIAIVNVALEFQFLR